MRLARWSFWTNLNLWHRSSYLSKARDNNSHSRRNRWLSLFRKRENLWMLRRELLRELTLQHQRNRMLNWLNCRRRRIRKSIKVCILHLMNLRFQQEEFAKNWRGLLWSSRGSMKLINLLQKLLISNTTWFRRNHLNRKKQSFLLQKTLICKLLTIWIKGFHLIKKIFLCQVIQSEKRLFRMNIS